MKAKKVHYVVSPRPNLFFDGDLAVVEWFVNGMRKRWIGPQALLIRDNGTPTVVPATKLEAKDFILVVGVYNYTVTAEQVSDDVAFFWIRNLGEREKWT